MNLCFYGVSGIPMVKPGDNLVTLINEGLVEMEETLENQDVVVIAQKIHGINDGHHGVQAGDIGQAHALFIGKGKGFRNGEGL